MAITKILHMKSSGGSFPGKHLKQAIDYITVPEKTGNGRYVKGVNCQPEFAFQKMQETKKKFGKTDKRQGYHIIISFEEQDVDPETAYEITDKFVEQYLGNLYEAVYAVHDNTEHTHAHIIFNSVSCHDGRKFRYEKGDWAKYIQPITNALCEEYGLSTITIEDGVKRENDRYKEWNDFRDGKYVWSDMIRRDLDACILQAPTFESFLDMLKEKGYDVKQNKYLAIKPMGMTRFKRCGSLGDNYTEERIRERILTESLQNYRPLSRKKSPKIIRATGFQYYKRAKLSGIQKKYFRKLYQTGKLKKRPYSQAWKYRDEIRKMHKYHEQYMFLAKNNVRSLNELLALQQSLEVLRKEYSKERSSVYRAKKSFQPLFDLAKKMSGLESAEISYQNGDDFFEEEHAEYERCKAALSEHGYTYREVTELSGYYEEKMKQKQSQCRDISKSLGIANGILTELKQEAEALQKGKDEEKEQNQELNRNQERQLRR